MSIFYENPACLLSGDLKKDFQLHPLYVLSKRGEIRDSGLKHLKRMNE
jgi:hypothetical protein